MIRPWLVRCVGEGRSERMDEGESRRQLRYKEPTLQQPRSLSIRSLGLS